MPFFFFPWDIPLPPTPSAYFECDHGTCAGIVTHKGSAVSGPSDTSGVILALRLQIYNEDAVLQVDSGIYWAGTVYLVSLWVILKVDP